jgi:8-oxo-dGTP pyrophosphatase MutT (NUDIX family)
MQQKYAVYLNRKALLFNNSQNFSSPLNTVKTFFGNSITTIQQGFKWLTEVENENAAALFPEIDYKNGIELLKTEFKFIVAAGGVVANSANDLLFIERLGLWDLPKGKVEEEESVEVAAIREIIEETGLGSLQNQEFLCSTFHIYWLKNKFILKESVWFSFNTLDNNILIPQQEENITKAEWIKQIDISQVLSHTYPSIIEVMETYKIKKGLTAF